MASAQSIRKWSCDSQVVQPTTVWAVMPARYQYTLQTKQPGPARPPTATAPVKMDLLPNYAMDTGFMVTQLFPVRPCSYVRDSRHRMQNNILRSIGASNSPRQKQSTAFTAGSGSSTSARSEHKTSGQPFLIHVRNGSSKIRQPQRDFTNSQAKLVKGYLTKNIHRDARRTGSFQQSLGDDWLRIQAAHLPSSSYRTLTKDRPRTTRSVVTGLHDRRISKLHIGCTLNSPTTSKLSPQLSSYVNAVN